MTIDRLSHLQKQIKRFYEQIQDNENALTTAPPGGKAIIKQRIEDLQEELAPIKAEYWRCWESMNSQLKITDTEAEVITAEIFEQVEILESQPAVQSNLELVELMNEIKAELTKPEIPGSGKLKAAIPLIPGFLAYEMELDTEGLLRRLFPTFSKLAGKLKKTQA
jgi:hypothetical protein